MNKTLSGKPGAIQWGRMRQVLKSIGRGIFYLGFAALVAAGFPLHVVVSASPIPVEQTVPEGTLQAGPSAVSTQEKPIPKPSDTVLDTTVEIEIRSDFNELRRELLDHRMKAVDWWLAVMAIVLTLIAVVAPIASIFGFKRFREIEIEARKGVETTKAATEQAKISVEEAKLLVGEIKSKRDEAVSHTKQITSMTAKEEPAKAGEFVQSTIANPSTSPIERVISAAILLQRRGDIQGAIKKWFAVAEIADGIDSELGSRAWFSVGYLHAAERRFREAIDGYDKAIRLKPDLAEAFYNRGRAKSDLGLHETVLADYDEAIRLKPDFAEAFYNRGFVKYDLGRHEAALADYDEAIRLKPDFAEALVNRGYVKDRLGRHEAAFSDFDEAIRLKPDFAEAFYNRGFAECGLGRHEAALADYDEAIRLKPDYAEALVNRGVVKINLGRHEAALADYDEAIRLKPDFAEAFNNRGTAKTNLNRHEDALADYDKAICLQPKHKQAFYNRGNANLELGRHEDAISDYNEAIRLNPGFALARLELAKAHFALGHLDEARQVLDTARNLARAAGDELMVNMVNQVYESLFGGDDS